MVFTQRRERRRQPCDREDERRIAQQVRLAKNAAVAVRVMAFAIRIARVGVTDFAKDRHRHRGAFASLPSGRRRRHEGREQGLQHEQNRDAARNERMA